MNAIADACFASLTETPAGLRVGDPAAVERVLAGFLGKPQCVDAVREIVVVAYFCARKLDAPEAGAALLALAEAAIPTLGRFSTSLDAIRGDGATRARLLGIDQGPNVPSGQGGDGKKWWQLRR